MPGNKSQAAAEYWSTHLKSGTRSPTVEATKSYLASRRSALRLSVKSYGALQRWCDCATLSSMVKGREVESREVLVEGLDQLDHAGASLADLSHVGSALIRLWYKIETSRTDVLRELAKVVVHTRSRFKDERGLPDCHGQRCRQIIRI